MRSPLLGAYKDWTDRETPRIVGRRRAVVGVLAAISIALAALMRGGLLPEPAAYALYWLHDYLALPIWGYTWSLFAPYSLTWWSLSALLFVVWLGTFLTRRSVTRRAHVRLAQWVIRSWIAGSSRAARHVARLLAAVDWLAAHTLGAELLRDVARIEHSVALAALVTAADGDQTAARGLVRLTDLYTRLMSGAGAPRGDRWRAAAAWHQALMWIDRRTATGVRSDVREALLRELVATGAHVLEQLEPDDAAAEDALAIALGRDLSHLVAYAAPCPPDERAAHASAIVRSAASRLDDLWKLAEQLDGDDGHPRLVAKTVDGTVIEAFGILTAGIGLHAAWLAGSVHLATDYVQVFEALTFVQHLGIGGREDVRLARHLTAAAPLGDQYRFAADMVETHAARLESAPILARPILDEALGHARLAVGALADAGGPDFDRSRPPAAGDGAQPAPRWRTGGRDLRDRFRHQLRHRPIPLRRRVDPILIAGSLAAVALYGVTTSALVLFFGSNDVGNWSARSLADRRILENVRYDLGARPFLDAIVHAPDRQLVISQAGGTIHSYDPATALWRTARPFGRGELAAPDVRLLASSPDAGSGAILWGITADGGLVRRDRGRWEVAVSDVRFVGSTGAVVQHADLRAVAASADGRWLVVGAGAAGVGIQDIERRRWLAPEEIARTDKPSAVTHAAWWWDRFYVGGPDGLSEILVDRERVAIRRVKDFAGAIVALEPAPGHGLFVLQTVACQNGPKDCARLSMVAQPFARPAVLIDEQNRYPELSLDKTIFAEQWKDHLILAGANGIFTYDTRLRSWKRAALEPITTVAPCASGPCFYYGYGGRSGGVGLFTPKTLAGEVVPRWPLPGEQPARVAASPSGSVAVLSASGRAYAVGTGAPSVTLHPATSSAIPPERFRDAVTFGDKVLFFGEPGALLHDVARRDYRLLTAVPDWLRAPEAIVRASGAYLFGLERQGSKYLANVVPQRQVELGTLVLNTATPLTIEGPIRAIDATSRDVLRAIDGLGRVVSIGPGAVAPLTGARAADLAGARPLDVAASPDGLAVSTARGVRLYSNRLRAWTDHLAAPAGETVVEIAQRGGAERGRRAPARAWLARSAGHRLVTLGESAAIVIGGGREMPAGSPTGALASGSDIYLAWKSAVARYDARTRGVSSIWPIDSDRPVHLAAAVAGEPLTLSAGVARLGSREIARDVHHVFSSNSSLWLTRQERGERFLEIRPLPSPPPTPAAGAQAAQPAPRPASDAASCFFRNPTAGADVTELRDARLLPSGIVAATTNAGLRLYSRQRRSWYGPVPDLAPGSGRHAVYTLGSTLLVSDPADGATTLQIVRSDVRMPDSCSTGPAGFDRLPEIGRVRSVAADERAGRVFALRFDGGIDEIRETGTTPMMGAANEGPRESEIVRAWHFPDIAPAALWVATAGHVWRYDLARHVWARIDVAIDGAGPIAPDTPIDLQAGANAVTVTATRPAGDSYGGSLDAGTSPQLSVVLRRLDAASTPRGRRSASPVFRIGAVTFFREVRHGILAVLETEDGRSLTAYRAGRFLWDTGRSGLAGTSEGLFVQSDAGVHAAAALANFDPGPPGPVAASDRLETGPDLVPRFYRAGRWYRRVIPGLWDPVVESPADAVVVRDDDMEWIRRRDTITVESLTGGRRTPVLTSRAGVGLATDRLIDAASLGGGYVLLSEGFVDLAEIRPGAAIPTTTVRLAAPASATTAAAGGGAALETLTIAGQETLWLTRPGSVMRWSPDRQSFEAVSPDADPFKRRVLVERGPLRLELVDGEVAAQLRVADLAGATRWAPVRIENGRFPFDVVRSVAATGDALYVGTDAGLQIYEAEDLTLENARIIALGSGPGSPGAVDRLGERCSDPGTFVACAGRNCFRRSAQSFEPASPGDSLACRLRARSSLWSWTADADGVTGRYFVVDDAANPGAPTLPVVPGPPISLVDGRFPHDEISQVIAFDTRLFTVWQGRQVGVHGTGLQLTSDVRTHQFADPVRLVAIADPIPVLRSLDREIGPGLFAIEGGRAWRFATDRWARIADAAEIETIADADVSRPVLQRRRLRLVRKGSAKTLTFEMRRPGRDWEPMAWDATANRLAIDVWQNIAVKEGTLWIATPAGLLGRDGNWSFDPNAFHLVDAPPGEAGRTTTDLRIEGNAAVVRYDGDSSKVYRIGLDQPQVTRSDTDPFAEQAFSVDSRYWQWGLSGRVGASVGRLAATWRGEPIGITNGRFDFDGVNALAVFDGQLHVTTGTRGWFASPPGSAALETLTRPNYSGLSPLDVTAVSDNRDPTQRELCLKEVTGQFARLSPGGAVRRTQGCPVLAAGTTFWRYLRDASTFRIVPTTGMGRHGERRLVDGRFSDEVVIGAPVGGVKDNRRFTLVPTTAGVMMWDDAGRTVDMYAPPFQGQPDVPRLLQWTPGASPAYVSGGTLYSLEGDDKPRAAWAAGLPDESVLERLGAGPGPLLWLDWSNGGRRHHTVVDPRNNSISHDEIPVDARRVPAYFRRAMMHQSHDGLIRLRLRDKIIEAYAGAQGWPLVEVDESFQLLAGAAGGTRAILIGPRHLIELNMEQIAAVVYSGGHPPPREPAPKK